MQKVYKSKVDNWYRYICMAITALFVGSIILCYSSTLALLISIIYTGICLCVLFDILLHTDYTIKEEKLYIRCGILYRMVLPIKSIVEIKHKSTILSSPALSAKRIGIRYRSRSWVYVSPKNQEDFITDLKSINPEIIVN